MKAQLMLLACFLALFVCVPACPAAAVKHVPHEIIVKFRPGVGADAIQRINVAHGTAVLYTSPFAGFSRMRIPGNRTVEEMVEVFHKNPKVDYAVPNSIAHAHFLPNDPLYDPYQWNFDDQVPGGNPYGGANGGGINLEPAWDISKGLGAVVAVLDSGVAYEDYGKYREAPDLAGTDFVSGWDFINNDAHANDDNSHGTHVTGTIAQSTDNAMGVAGVAFECSIMPVKVLNKNGGGTLQQVVDGIYYAVDHGAHVINMSLGWPPGYDPGQPLKDALDYAYGYGVTVVCSSGNDGAGTVSYPAAYWSTIAVGATRYDETRPSYSNYGAALDLTAPGGDLSVNQNGDAYGDGILQNTFHPISKNPRDFSYWFFDGTSMAAPHVSGVAALLIANGVVGPDDVRFALESTAEDKGDPGWDPEYGWGIVDAYAALNAILTFTVGDDVLVNFERTWGTGPPGMGLVEGIADVEGPGVIYDVALYGIGDVELGIGDAPPVSDMSAYDEYVLTLTNLTEDDFFLVCLYLETGEGRTFHQSRWQLLAPGFRFEMSLPLDPAWELDDVREIGFGLKAIIGDGIPWANAMLVQAEGSE